MSSQCAVDGHLLVSINNNLDSTSPFLPSPHFRPLQQIHHPHHNTSSTAAMHAETFLAAASNSSNHNLNHGGDGGGGNTRSRTALPPRKRIKTGGLSSSGSPPASPPFGGSPPSSPPLASALSFSAGSKKPIKASIEYLLSSNRDSDALESPSFEDTTGKNPDNTAPSSSSRSSSSSAFDQQLQNHPQQHTQPPIATSSHMYSGRRLGHTKSPSRQASSPSHYSTSPYREPPLKEEDLVQKSEDVARLLSQLPPRRAKMEQIATSSSSRSSGEEERWEDDPPEQIRPKRRTKNGDSPLVASVRNSEKRKKRIIYEEEEQYEEDESCRHAPSKIKQRVNRINPDFQTLATRPAKTTPKSQHQTPHSASQQQRLKVELTKPRNSTRGRKKKTPSNEDLANTTESHTDAKTTGRRDRKRRSASHREELDESPLESEEDAPQCEEEEDGEEEEEEDANALYCICRRPYDADLFMIACDGCDEWYHGTCVNISEKEAKSLKTYLCPLCQKKKMKKERAAKERRQKKERRREIQQQQQLQQQRKQKKEPKSSSNHHSKSTRFLAQLTSAAKEEEREVYPTRPPRTCINCGKTAKPHSKYCSDGCGLEVAKRKLMMQQQQRTSATATTTKRPKPSPSPLSASALAVELGLAAPSEDAGSLAFSSVITAVQDFSPVKRSLKLEEQLSSSDESDLRQLESLEEQKREVEKHLKSLQEKSQVLEQAIEFSATLVSKNGEAAEEVDVERGGGNDLRDCFSCGQPIPAKSFARHSEQCYAKIEGTACSSANKIESQVTADGVTIAFCNYYDSRNGSYCTRLRDACPFHSEKKRKIKSNQLCGCPTSDFESGYCTRLKKGCSKHVNWETIRRLELAQEQKGQIRLLASLENKIKIVQLRITRRRHSNDQQHRTIEENHV
ncbi:CXXC-type zinc finger protein 1 [Balamuthia mandrillaris]